MLPLEVETNYPQLDERHFSQLISFLQATKIQEEETIDSSLQPIKEPWWFENP